MEKHTVSRLVGSPPGYIGYGEGGQLTERDRRKPYSVVLLDEIEKANADIFNILLQVLEDGQLTDSMGRKVNFRNTVVIMTSNVGARQIQRKSSLGFAKQTEEFTYARMKEMVMSEIKKIFNPEFLNRLDETIIFESLTDEDLEKIVDLLILQVNENLARRGLSVNLNPDVRRWIVDTTCQDRSYGARPLRRAIQKYIEDPLSEALIKNSLPAGSSLEVILKDNALCYITAGQDHREAIPLYH